jgi:hypothetical protein
MERKQITPFMLKELERVLQTPGIKIERKQGCANFFDVKYTVVDDMGQELLYFKRRYHVLSEPIDAPDEDMLEFWYNIKFKGTEIVKDVVYTKEREQFSNSRLCLYNKIFSLLNEKYTNAEKVACGQDRITFFDKIRQAFKCKVK